MPRPLISLMLAGSDATAAAASYQEALGATELWNLGSVTGMDVDGVPLSLAEPEGNGWANPDEVRITTVRGDVFVQDPDRCVATSG